MERTASNNVSTYNETRSGGTRKETVIKKIVGNVQDLKKDIVAELKFKKDDVNINPVTGHIKIKVRRDMPAAMLEAGCGTLYSGIWIKY